MNSVADFVVFGILGPASTATALALFCRRFLPPDVAGRYAFSVSMAAGFALGFGLSGLGAVWPTRHWHWLVYLALLASVLGPIALAAGVRVWERNLLWAVVSVMASLVLVPSWPGIADDRHWYGLWLAGYLFVGCRGMPLLARRVSARSMLGALALTAVVLAFATAAFVSVLYGRIAALAAAATTGCFAACWFGDFEDAVRGLFPVSALLVGGSAFLAFIEPRPPEPGFLVIPLAPFALGVTNSILQLKAHPRFAAAIHLTAVLLVLSAGIAWLWLGN